ncbi:DNA alkylation repair protein [Terriglobus roseus]|uniref:3-methyladenine DNA glycosylase AlkD n=1 Tax=Terriglobus roseus TaxID=392734 RepID=A0A1G7PZY8_9BACT|nr:DNA alkylation repair protein [Terriglobus roseus]SDF91778.1 3-methyladenine DNA glycosylase AlkD [Terriglobus roseus]
MPSTAKSRATLAALKRDVNALRDPERARFLQRFFRTGTGEYAEGDKMLGLTVPDSRKIARAYAGLQLHDVAILLASPWHEHRLIALLILIAQHDRASQEDRAALHGFYVEHRAGVNNWDLVDTSARALFGEHDLKGRLALRYAKSADLWDRRIAMVSTFAALKRGETAPTFAVAEKLLDDRHDLIHKATGWLLREAGKVDHGALMAFLRQHYARMPRTALRYAIERLDSVDRRLWLAGPQ